MDYQIPQVWQVNRNLPMPLFKQVAENIKWTIYNGNIKAGTKLPPVHQLAKSLGVSVSTIQNAYQILEDDELIITRPHHGTEILDISERKEKSNDINHAFSKVIKDLLNRDYSEQEINEIFKHSMEAALNKKKILFIECDKYDKKTLAKQLSEFLDIKVDFILLNTLTNQYEIDESIDYTQYIAIVTTYFHYSKVMEDYSFTNLPVYAVVTEFSKSTIQKISGFKPGTKVAVLHQPQHSADFNVSMIESIRTDLDIRKGIISEDNDQNELIKWADVCFPNHPCENTVLSIDPNKPVYFFGEQINAQSIGILQKNLSSIRSDFS